MKFAALLALATAIKIEGDNGIVDAFSGKDCEPRLWIHKDELDWQMDQFSRKFDIKNYNNAREIAKELGVALPKAHTWELLDKSFSFPRVRRYPDVQDNLDQVEHFQDNFNLNPSNSVNVQNFIRAGKTAVNQLGAKYSDGEFSNPANFDPREAAKKK